MYFLGKYPHTTPGWLRIFTFTYPHTINIIKIHSVWFWTTSTLETDWLNIWITGSRHNLWLFVHQVMARVSYCNVVWALSRHSLQIFYSWWSISVLLIFGGNCFLKLGNTGVSPVTHIATSVCWIWLWILKIKQMDRFTIHQCWNSTPWYCGTPPDGSSYLWEKCCLHL